jgi:hypothetical protein
MTLPASGAISFNAINVELGQPGTTTANINQASYRTLAGIPSGTISLGNFYGKSNRVTISLTASGNNYDVYSNRGPTYSPGTSDITVTVPGTVGSSSTGSYAMLVPNAFNPGDTVTIINNGVIQGMGGNGGSGGNANRPEGTSTPGSGGGGGGNAIYVNRPTVITNNGTIASGGGGGGGGGSNSKDDQKPGFSVYAGGGGGGGGAGTNNGGGGGGGSAYNVQVPGPQSLPGNPGSPGSSSSGGAGGSPRVLGPTRAAGGGGAGGGRGAAGAAGAAASGSAPGGGYQPGGGGGGTGSYIVGNPFVTWPATGTRQGNVS